MTTTTMNAMNVPFATRKAAAPSRSPSLAFTRFLQQRAALPEMPEQESHVSAFTGVALRLAAAVLPVGALAWLALAG